MSQEEVLEKIHWALQKNSNINTHENVLEKAGFRQNIHNNIAHRYRTTKC